MNSSSSAHKAQHNPPGAAAWVGLMLALVWAPLPLGSNRPWAVGLLVMLVLGLWAMLHARVVHAGLAARLAARLRDAWPPLALLAALCMLPLAQLWVDGATADAARTREYLLRTLLYSAAFVLTLCLATTSRRVLGLLGAVVAAGVLQAGLAVVLYSTGASYDFLFMPFEQGQRAMGTFPNPDHLAGYMELALAAGLGLMLSQFGGEQQPPRRQWQPRMRAALVFLMSGKMLLRMMLVLLVIALVMTHSRMGNGAFLLSLLLVGSVVATVSRRLRRPAIWLVVSMLVIDVVIIGQWVGLDRVVQRLQGTGVSGLESSASFGFDVQAAGPPREESITERLAAPRMALALVAQRPWFGHGGGSFYTVFPPYKTQPWPWLWDHAHNDYVEVAADTGLIGLALWVGLGVVTAVRALKLLFDHQPRLNRGVGAAALLALSSIGLHSMVDFNLQIPANALTLTVLLALAWSVPMHSPSSRRASTLQTESQ
jgi:O-antigen ligase